MWITPHNYLLSDPSRQSKQMIHIDLDEDGIASDVSTYGQKLVNVTVNQVSAFGRIRNSALMTKVPIEWDAMTYVGDVVTRKFPYDRKSPSFGLM
jgi:primary-amine oxidase